MEILIYLELVELVRTYVAKIQLHYSYLKEYNDTLITGFYKSYLNNFEQFFPPRLTIFLRVYSYCFYSQAAPVMEDLWTTNTGNSIDISTDQDRSGSTEISTTVAAKLNTFDYQGKQIVCAVFDNKKKYLKI